MKKKEDRIYKYKLLVTCSAAQFREEATSLAAHLGVPMTEDPTVAGEAALRLQLDEKGLALAGEDLHMQGDLSRMLPRLKQANLQGELLVKAAKRRDFEGLPVLWDATAGMGEDSLLLAAAGFRVELFEFDPVIAALLRDSLERARALPDLEEIVSRMHLHEGDSIRAMWELTEGKSNIPAPDVILLDPMFPERQKSGMIKKKFQLLQQLESPCGVEEELLEAALAVCPRKVIIKRPAKGPYLAGRKPDYSLPGKAIRYDCILGRNINI